MVLSVAANSVMVYHFNPGIMVRYTTLWKRGVNANPTT
ncbi:hypothetical protein MC7420_3135 [Coleofasciculus chthonoplastes PCC 7420]|uniref:Uncharacterized protein n=1 Tax=Coleofasciculus chthonoplastes PCC 7420 TaxID=118168 RepID=B4VJP1_9CYAN|nr:hypothetical protein MC7420_3135 [Coleofasciculus chthonoplastes PCC 7420]